MPEREAQVGDAGVEVITEALNQLRDQGLITNEEYEAKHRQILDRCKRHWP